MAKYLRNILVVLAVIALVVFLSGHAFLYYLMESGKLKDLSEGYLSQLLNSEVKIHKIEPSFFHKVKITGVEVRLSDNEEPFWIHIKEVFFNYNFFQLLSNKMNSPTAIELATPSLKLNHREVFKELNSSKAGYLSSLLLSEIKLVGGNLEYYFPSLDKTIHITDVNIHAFPASTKRLNIEMKGVSSGFFESKIKLSGYWDLESHDYLFKLSVSEGLTHLDFTEHFENIRGSVTLRNDELSIDSLETSSNGWSFQFSGQVKNLAMYPESDIVVRIGKPSEAIGNIQLNYKSEEKFFAGNLNLPGFEGVPFQGRMIHDNKNVKLKDMKVANDYQGSGELDFETGDYQLRFNNDFQRFKILSNLNADELFVDLDLNHFKLFDLDLVTLASLRFWPAENHASLGSLKLRGQFTSQYFILEQHPLENFEGSFLFDAQGIRDLRTTWGESFEMNGDIHLKQNRANAHLALRVLDYDLENVDDLLNRPLPKRISGVLNGKLKIDGQLSKPEVLGQFTVKDGSVGKLDFDRMTLQMRGFPPYLKLDESKIIKGRTNFHLVGAFDLSLDNPFHGIHVETSDKVIVWKGLSLTTNQEDQGFDFETAFPGLGKLALDFSTSTGRDQHQSDEELRDENYIALKPKIKF